MECLKEYVSSDSDTELDPQFNNNNNYGGNIRRTNNTKTLNPHKKLKVPPSQITHKYSKIPIKNSAKTKVNNDKIETSFVYIPFQPSLLVISKFNKIIEFIIKNNPILVENYEPTENYLINKLTKTPKELHISLSYNLHFTKANLDQFIEELKNKESIKNQFPMFINFQNEVKLLPNSNNTKIFVCLMLKEKLQNILKPIVAKINSKNKQYDSTKLHLSIGEFNIKTNNIKTNKIKFKSPQTVILPYSIPAIEVNNIIVSKGRSVVDIMV